MGEACALAPAGAPGTAAGACNSSGAVDDAGRVGSGVRPTACCDKSGVEEACCDTNPGGVKAGCDAGCGASETVGGATEAGCGGTAAGCGTTKTGTGATVSGCDAADAGSTSTEAGRGCEVSCGAPADGCAGSRPGCAEVRVGCGTARDGCGGGVPAAWLSTEARERAARTGPKLHAASECTEGVVTNGSTAVAAPLVEAGPACAVTGSASLLCNCTRLAVVDAFD